MLAISVSARAPALAQGEDEVFHYLIPLAEAVNLSESGLHEQAINKTKKLLNDLNSQKGSAPKVNRALPVLRGDTSCGDVYRQLQAEALALKGMSSFTLKRSPQAIADLKQAAAMCPEHAYVLCELGTVLVKSKKHKEGIVALTRAIKLNQNIREAYFMRANAYQHVGRLKESKSDLSRAQMLFTEQQKNIDSLTERIDKLVQENKITEALEVDRQLMHMAPRDGLAVTGYADHLTSDGKYKDALNYVSTAIALDPTIGYPYRIRSVINSHMQNPDAELRDANIAFSIEPRSAEALNSRAIANLDADHPVQAIRDFDLLVKRTPQFADAYINRSTAYLRIGEFEKAIKDAKRSVALVPASPYGYQCLGAALRRAGQLKEARDALETSLRYTKTASPDSVAMAQFNLGAVLRELKDPKSIDHIDAAIKLAPNLPEIFLQRGAYNASLGKIDDAIKILTRKTTRSFNTAKVSKLVRKKTSVAKPAVSSPRKIEASLLDLQDCMLVANRMIEITPGKNETYYTRGLANLCLKQYEQAASDFRRLAELTKTGFRYQQAQVLGYLSLERIGKTKDARDCLDLAATKGGTKPAGLPELKYFRNEITEPALFAGKLTVKELTRTHSYLGFHFNSLADKTNANRHVRWVLDQGGIACPELVLTATDNATKPVPAGTKY